MSQKTHCRNVKLSRLAPVFTFAFDVPVQFDIHSDFGGLAAVTEITLSEMNESVEWVPDPVTMFDSQDDFDIQFTATPTQAADFEDIGTDGSLTITLILPDSTEPLPPIRTAYEPFIP
jgi:hypothetical protein